MITPDALLQNRYRIVRLLGQGGMGAVYLAIDERLGHQVALKQMFYAQNEALAQAFEREARILARLNHRCLPKVSDHFSEGEARYLVMQYIDGHDLGTLLERSARPFPVAQILSWADSLLDALEYLHRHEPPILHRDIKPQNLKINPQGELYLLDFGLAKDTATNFSNPLSPPSVLGFSLNYSPLEQIERQRTTVETDVYAVCATLYHLLTNQLPADALTRLRDKADGSPDPLIPAHQINPQISPEIAALLERGLNFRRENRPQVPELRRALKSLSNFQPGQQPPQNFQTGKSHDAEKTIPYETPVRVSNQSTPRATQALPNAGGGQRTQSEYARSLTPPAPAKKRSFLPLIALLLFLSTGALVGASYVVYRMLPARGSNALPTPAPTALATPLPAPTSESSSTLSANGDEARLSQNNSNANQSGSSDGEKSKSAERQAASKTSASKQSTQKSNPPDKKSSGGKKNEPPVIIP